MIEAIAPDVWVASRPLRFFGVPLGTRMTVIRTGDELLLHSPVAADPELVGAVSELGRVRHVVAPNRFHHLYCGDWNGDGVAMYGAPGLAKKRSDLRFDGTVGEALDWPDGVQALATTSFPLVGETVYFHAPSRTLIVSDLVFNLGPEAPFATRCAMTLAGAGSGLSTTLLERWGMRREAARAELEHILAWDFERIVLAHGEIVTERAQERLRDAYGWLLG